MIYTTNTIDPEKTIYEAHQRFLRDRASAYDSGYLAGKEEDQKMIEAKDAELSAKDAEIARLKALLSDAGIDA